MVLSESAARFNLFAYRLLYKPWPNPTIRQATEWLMRAIPTSSPPRQHFGSVPALLVETVLHDCGESAAATIAELCAAGMWVESNRRTWLTGDWVIERGRRFRIFRPVPIRYPPAATAADSKTDAKLHLEICDAQTLWRDSTPIEALRASRRFFDLSPLGRNEAATRFRPPPIDERVEFCGMYAATVAEWLGRATVWDDTSDGAMECRKAPLAESLRAAAIASDFEPRIGTPLSTIRGLVKLAADADWYPFVSGVSDDSSRNDTVKALQIPAAHDFDHWRKLRATLREIARVAAAPSEAAGLGTRREKGTSQKNKRRGHAVESERQLTADEAKDFPDFDYTSGFWVTGRKATSLEQLRPRTLSDYRKQGRQSEDRMYGIDPDGRKWRRPPDGSAHAHPWYYEPSLRKPRRKSG